MGFPNRRFQFQKRSQDFIGTHDETLSATIQIVCPLESTPDTQPQRHPFC